MIRLTPSAKQPSHSGEKDFFRTIASCNRGVAFLYLRKRLSAWIRHEVLATARHGNSRLIYLVRDYDGRR